MKITYGITVNNEIEEIKSLLPSILNNIEKDDEVLVLQDITSEEYEVTNYIQGLMPEYEHQIKYLRSKLNSDFSSFKNTLIENSTGDYLFQIDADEIVSLFLIENLKIILNVNHDIDVFNIPRINRVNGITAEHIKKWGWRRDSIGRINFPDLQMRLFKLNKGIKWVNKVHEVLDGYQSVTTLPYDVEDFCLYHIKNIDRQERQNNFYSTL